MCIRDRVRGVNENKDGNLDYDRVVDTSSFFAIWYFDVLAVNDARLSRAAKVVNKLLHVAGDIGGYIRYENDSYYQLHDSPNPWIVTTLWMTQYQIKKATKPADLEAPLNTLKWAHSQARNSMFAEQISPQTGEHLSTSPLVWSHAEFVITINSYLQKLISFQLTGKR